MSSDNVAVQITDVTKIFHIHHNAPTTIFERLSKSFSKKNIETLLALDQINIKINHGEMIGIIGKNGSGKTTLLRVIAGIIEPTSGRIMINGKMAPFLSLGASFNPELDSRENIILYGMLLGIPKKIIISKINSILEFAELEKYADVKLKHFSTGMFMRLAFSVAISIEPDIFLIDEVMAVGDESFQEKSFQKLLSFKKQGRTIILVSHNLTQVEKLCDRAILIQNGKISAVGNSIEVVKKYKDSL